MPRNELAVIIRRFQRAGQTFRINLIDGSFTYIDDTCEVVYRTDGLNLAGHIKTGHQRIAYAECMYIPYKSIVEVARFI